MKVKVLFVCMGNICRSPMAEGVFRLVLENAKLADKVFVDSAGTHSYHLSSPPDNRAQETASRRGVILEALRARQVSVEDFENFDYILAMDLDNYHYLLALCPQSQPREKIRLMMEYAPDLPEREVPDPYYGGRGGFERVMDLLEAASQGLLRSLREEHHL